MCDVETSNESDQKLYKMQFFFSFFEFLGFFVAVVISSSQFILTQTIQFSTCQRYT